MNSENAKDYLPLVAALADGKTIQGRALTSTNWVDFESNEDVDFTDTINHYRIKPEPVERWGNIYKGEATIYLHASKQVAEANVDRSGGRTILMREVTE